DLSCATSYNEEVVRESSAPTDVAPSGGDPRRGLPGGLSAGARLRPPDLATPRYLSVGDRRSGARGVPGPAQVLDRLRSGAPAAPVPVRDRLSDRGGASPQTQPRGDVRDRGGQRHGPRTRRRACNE